MFMWQTFVDDFSGFIFLKYEISPFCCLRFLHFFICGFFVQNFASVTVGEDAMWQTFDDFFPRCMLPK